MSRQSVMRAVAPGRLAVGRNSLLRWMGLAAGRGRVGLAGELVEAIFAGNVLGVEHADHHVGAFNRVSNRCHPIGAGLDVCLVHPYSPTPSLSVCGVREAWQRRAHRSARCGGQGMAGVKARTDPSEGVACWRRGKDSLRWCRKETRGRGLKRFGARNRPRAGPCTTWRTGLPSGPCRKTGRSARGRAVTHPPLPPLPQAAPPLPGQFGRQGRRLRPLVATW